MRFTTSPTDNMDRSVREAIRLGWQGLVILAIEPQVFKTAADDVPVDEWDTLHHEYVRAFSISEDDKREIAFEGVIRKIAFALEPKHLPDKRFDQFVESCAANYETCLLATPSSIAVSPTASRNAEWMPLCVASIQAFAVIPEAAKAHLLKLLHDILYGESRPKHVGRCRATGVTIWGSSTLSFQSESLRGPLTTTIIDVLPQQTNLGITVTVPLIENSSPDARRSYALEFWRLMHAGDAGCANFGLESESDLTVYCGGEPGRIREIAWNGCSTNVNHTVGDDDQTSAWLFVFALLGTVLIPGKK